MNNELIKYLAGFITNNRFERFNEVIEYRTRYITIILEDIYQPHNASAVLRSCECFGVQDVHIIENNNKYSVNPDVALGSNKWLDIIKYNTLKNNTVSAIKQIKKKGYRIVATTPQINKVNLDNFDIKKGKVALLFGTELNGLSDEALNLADEFLNIPMFGFTESFNISVTVAIILKTLIYKLHHSNIIWKLSKKEREDLKLKWLKNSIKNSDFLIKNYKKKNNNISIF